jgi:probable phosphoglycerate mutase
MQTAHEIDGPYMKIVAYFARHGTTEANQEHKFRGPLDIPLDDRGKEDAENLASYFKGRSFSGAFSSSKTRSKDTLDTILKKVKNAPKPEAVKNLDPLNVGDLAGKPKDEKSLKIIQHHQDNPDEKIPGGERLNDFRKRVDPKIMMIIRRGEESGTPSLSVVHSSTIHQISHLFHGNHNAVKVRPGGIVAVYKDPQSPKGYTARAILKESYHPDDKHFGS